MSDWGRPTSPDGPYDAPQWKSPLSLSPPGFANEPSYDGPARQLRPPRPPRPPQVVFIPSDEPDSSSDQGFGAAVAASSKSLAPDKVIESVSGGSRHLHYSNRSCTIPVSHTPAFGPNGFGYYVKSNEDLLFYPVGERGPDSATEFSGLPPLMTGAMHQIMSINLAERFNGDWKPFVITVQPVARWLRSVQSEEANRIAEALYRKASRELPGFQGNVPMQEW